jgi:hypothetical protein
MKRQPEREPAVIHQRHDLPPNPASRSPRLVHQRPGESLLHAIDMHRYRTGWRGAVMVVLA